MTDEGPLPLVMGRLELCEPDLIFKPSLDRNMTNNLYDLSMGLLHDIYGMAELVPRVSNPGETYLGVVWSHKQLEKMRRTFIERVEDTISDGNEAKDSYLQYSYLWLESKTDYMYNFLHYSRQLSEEELHTIQSGKLIKEVQPKLSDFEREIEYFENIYEEVKKLDKSTNFNSWFSVDLSPLRLTLEMCAKKWSYLFKKHLLGIVVTSLTELQNFLEEAEIGLQTQISEGDYEGLVKVMGYIRAVKDRQPGYEALVQEMSDTISLLQSFNVDIPEASVQQITVLPDAWTKVKQLSAVSKHHITSLQNLEVNKLTLKVETYEKKQKSFRNHFCALELFSYSCRKPYTILRKVEKKNFKSHFMRYISLSKSKNIDLIFCLTFARGKLMSSYLG